MTAEQAADRSCQHVIAGLVIRLADHLVCCVPGRLGVFGVIAVPADDVAGIGDQITDTREWAVLITCDTISPTETLRRLARQLDADPTGNQTYLTRQIHASLDGRQLPAVAIVGTVAVRPCLAAFELLAGHPRLVLAVLTDVSTLQNFRRHASRPLAFDFRADTVAERECLGRVLMRLRRPVRGPQAVT